MFLFKGKRDNDLFNQKEEKKSGLNTANATMEKVA